MSEGCHSDFVWSLLRVKMPSTLVEHLVICMRGRQLRGGELEPVAAEAAK
jgi:hypothetical protein